MNLILASFLQLVSCLMIPVLSYMGESMRPFRPIFDTGSINLTAIAGSSATLPCSVENKGEHNVIWLNTRKTLISRDESRYMDDSRMSVERPKTADWNLLIREVRYNDSGEYMCQINTKPVLIKRLYLNVKVPPEIIEDYVPTDIQVDEGQRVELTCNATGVPAPDVQWTRRAKEQNDYTDNEIGSVTETLGLGEVLVLHNITRYCDGVYTCEADNGIKPLASKTFEVTVRFPPEVRLLTKRMGQSLGKETVLQCQVLASPHGSISWKKDGRDVPTYLNRYWTQLYTDNSHQKTLDLNIVDIEKSDFGNYTCEASNVLGSDSERMLLYEYINHIGRRPTTTTQRATSPTPTTNVYQVLTNYNNGKHTAGQSKKRPGLGMVPARDSYFDRNSAESVAAFPVLPAFLGFLYRLFLLT